MISIIETFERIKGTDNIWETKVGPGNTLNPDLSLDGLGFPKTWGKQAGQIKIGAEHGGCLWRINHVVPSPTGFEFNASYFVIEQNLGVGNAVGLAAARPSDMNSEFGAWRLYMYNHENTLRMVVAFGDDTATAQQISTSIPINTNVIYDVKVVYDSVNNMCLWNVNDFTYLHEPMPDEFPLIGTKVVGSSGSVDGRNVHYLVDNVNWQELS